MALTETALMGIACILAHAGENAQTDQWANKLDLSDKAKVVSLVQSKACLPNSIEALLTQSKSDGLKNGGQGVINGAPSRGTKSGAD